MKTFKELFGGKAKESHSLETVIKNEGNFTSHNHEHGTHVHSETMYQCPMKCEGEKTYNDSGNCPVCNMKLVPVSNSGSNDHPKGHEGHGHGHHGCC